MAKKSVELKKYTVFGVCREARHSYFIEAESPTMAERKARKVHTEVDSDILVVAGIARGHVDVMGDCDSGFDEQMEGKS